MPTDLSRQRSLRLGTGLVAGLIVAGVDNFAQHGRVSPMIVASLLFAAGAALCTGWGPRGLGATGLAWICLPASHLVKHLARLPDSLYPNTYASLGKLAVFSFLVAAVSAQAGIALYRLRRRERP